MNCLTLTTEQKMHVLSGMAGLLMQIAGKRKAELEAIHAAAASFRDAVLNARGPLEEPGLGSSQTNAVLALFDDTLGPCLTTHE